jgi:hypothetical protein
MKLRTVLSAALVGLVALPVSAIVKPVYQDADGHCGIYPQAVYEQTYAAYSDCTLRKVGEKPLWHGLKNAKYRQQIRFTFTDGHGRYTRVINFVELANGKGRIELKTIIPESGDVIVSDARRFSVSAEDVARINELAEASGTWAFESGTWDDEEIFLHCQTLDMERVSQAGYRFSSVNISCNQPQILMPLVEHLSKLVRLKQKDGMY